MAVSAVTGPNNSPATPGTNSLGGLGKDDFLKLLLAQLQNQDPLAPTDSTQMMLQLVQFSTLEAMQNIDQHTSMLLSAEQLSRAESMVGKQVTGTGTADDGSAETIEGVVDSVKMVDGGPVLLIGEKTLPLSSVTKVAPKQGSSDIALASNMIGMEIEAKVGASGTSVSGTVDSVKVVGGEPLLEVGNRDVKLSEITKVKEGTKNQG